ncbi:hypothetical protein [Clostridium intestinale]|jgi:hypothetical protein|uniref:Lipoprotein n=2 Tax=Clostridium intestinale TaxID=36845 RepID=A0A7D6ZTD8_9CLOT|nr:hypothetical protein [Clostridium intestinale]ERK32216.1 putative lipoprotein [Clostridium intestinale URNW]QLY79273.1 hypothetical protein HZF06_19720 [Clostridium intestinale]
MKKKTLLSVIAAATLAVTIFAGCGKKEDTAKTNTDTPTKTEDKTDAVTTASIVNDADAFVKAASKEGTWIIATLGDLKVDKEIKLDGEFKNGKKDDKGNDVIQRKIGLYTQDADHKVTARFTLTAPKLTVTSPNARIQSGTFKGDVYVSVDNFQLVDAKIDGNLYFTTDTAKSTFKMDDKSSVTGVQELKK